MASPRRPSQQARAVSFGARLRQLRRAQSLTQRQVAERVPMSSGNLSRIENGQQGPPADETIERLAAALSVDAEVLFRLAGRSGDAEGFEAAVLSKLDRLQQELTEGFARVEAALRAR
jgi:transcriptional regulator with XRE-family HTH domain